jgi:hypothetical protein
MSLAALTTVLTRLREAARELTDDQDMLVLIRNGVYEGRPGNEWNMT